MKTNTLSTSGFNPVVVLLGLVAVALTVMVLTGRKVPVLTTDRTELIGLVVIGMTICALAGIGPMSATRAWMHPLSIIGYLLGAVIIIIGIAAVFGKQIPLLTSYHQAFIVVVGISVLKIILTTIHRLFL